MKKILTVFCFLFLLSILVSCNVNNDKVNELTSNHEISISPSVTPTQPIVSESEVLTEEECYQIMNNYSTLKKAIIKEETVAKKDNIETEATRTSYIDIDKNYMVSNIEYDNLNGKINLINSNYYYVMGEKSEKILYNTGDYIYKSIGISKLFETTDFVYSQNKFTKTIVNETREYNFLFDNVNYDMYTNYSYNPHVLMVEIVFSEEKIEYINFDLHFVFGSFYDEIDRTIYFDFSDFEYSEQTDPIKKYDAELGSTLDTYVLEMVYQYGDAIYIESGNFDMLIDSGQRDDSENVFNMLEEHCEDNILDVLIVTHGHGDHIGGIQGGALKAIDDVRLMIDYGYSGNDYTYEKYRGSFSGDYYCADDCINFRNGAHKLYQFSDDITIEILDTGQYLALNEPLDTNMNENDTSVVFKLTYKDNTYLYTGDIAGSSYETSLKREDIKDITVYKAAHHGAVSYSSNTQSFLDYVNPEICVVSAAIYDQYDLSQQYHPTPSFVRRILKTPKISQNKNLYFNGTMGTIKLVDDGVNLPVVTGLGAKKGYYYNNELITGEQNLKFVETKLYELRY